MLFKQISKLTQGSEQAIRKANSLLNRIIMRGTGRAEEGSLLVGGEEIPSGDIEAMVEASEGGLKVAHRWITTGQKRISVNDDEGEVELDIETRSYVEDIETGQEMTRDVSVAALNVNNRTGRVYLHDAGHTVPFFIHKDAVGRTITNLSTYLDEYAHKTGATVNIRYRPLIHNDGRVKRLIVFDCFEIGDAA